MSGQLPPIQWPDGKDFAFSVFDDPDGQLLPVSERIYGFLGDLGFRTTKAVWMVDPVREPNSPGDTCQNPAFRKHCLELQEAGFEIGWHHAAAHGSFREETIAALDAFRDCFGAYPSSMANHYNEEAIYWTADRLTGWRRAAYKALSRGKSQRYFGADESSPYFWGDICRERIRYCRNFVFAGPNNLNECPWAPYHDASKPYVQAWFASTEGANCAAYKRHLTEQAQDQVEAEGGLCLMYTHYAHWFMEDGVLDPRFIELMRRLSKKNGWFAPVSTILDYVREQRGGLHELTPAERGKLERRWLREKVLRGTS